MSQEEISSEESGSEIESDSEVEEELNLSHHSEEEEEEEVAETRVRSTDYFVLEFNKPRKTVQCL